MYRVLKPAVFILCLLPAVWLIRGLLAGRLGANPAETVQLETGIWAFRFLLATLAITPLRRLTGANRLIQYRRMLGLFSFAYASLHLLSFLALDHLFALDGIWADVVDRPFITAGMLAYALMVPLALTSTRGWIRRLGRRWQMLHRLVYVSAIAAALHFVWKVKVVFGEPVYYAAIVAVLLLVRLLWFLPVAGRLRRPNTARARV